MTAFFDRVNHDKLMAQIAKRVEDKRLGERAHRLVKRHLRVGCMQLIDIDTLQLQPPQACLAGGAQMLRSAIPFPGLTLRSHEPAFGRDDQAFRIRVERFGNEPAR